MYDWRWRWRRWLPSYRHRYYRYWYDRPHFDRTYSDLLHRMNMFQTFLSSIPKNRSEMVNHLEIPDDILKPHVFEDFEDDLLRRDSLASGSVDGCDLKTGGLSTDSSVSLSRAMTDSEIDYDRYRRLRNRAADPFDELKISMEAFPRGYLDSLQSRLDSVPLELDTYTRCRPLYNEELERRMERYFQEECNVFSSDDEGLLDLADALDSIDLKALEADLDSIYLKQF